MFVDQSEDRKMSRAISVILILATGLARPISAQSTPLFIRHVGVVDVSAGQVLPDMTVEIRGRTIAAMDSGAVFAVACKLSVVKQEFSW